MVASVCRRLATGYRRWRTTVTDGVQSRRERPESEHQQQRHCVNFIHPQLNKPKQLNTINKLNTINPDLVILIWPSVRKRDGPFRGLTSLKTKKSKRNIQSFYRTPVITTIITAGLHHGVPVYRGVVGQRRSFSLSIFPGTSKRFFLFFQFSLDFHFQVGVVDVLVWLLGNNRRTVVYPNNGFTPAWSVSEWWLARTGCRDRRSA